MSAPGRARRPVVEPTTTAMRPRRPRVVLIALPMVAVFAAFGAVVWLAYEDGSYGSPIGEPPLVQADRSPLKIAPDDPGGREIADQGEVRELLSETVPPQTVERLLPPEEEPLTPAQRTIEEAARLAALPPTDPDTGDPATAPEIVVETVAEEPRVAAESDGVPAAVIAELPEPEPESSFSASGTGGPVDEGRPSTGTPSEAEAALDALLAEVTQSTGRRSPERAPAPAPAETLTTPAPTAPAQRDVATATPTTPQQVRPAVTASPAPPSATPRTTGARPADTSVANIAPGEPVGEIPARATSGPEPGEPLTVVIPRIEQAPDDGTDLQGRFRIQLAAVRAEADARRAWDLFQVDLGPLLQGHQPYIERADTGNGTFYRVQVGSFAALVEAETLCEDLKQRNASCFVVRR